MKKILMVLTIALMSIISIDLIYACDYGFIGQADVKKWEPVLSTEINGGEVSIKVKKEFFSITGKSGSGVYTGGYDYGQWGASGAESNMDDAWEDNATYMGSAVSSPDYKSFDPSGGTDNTDISKMGGFIKYQYSYCKNNEGCMDPLSLQANDVHYYQSIIFLFTDLSNFKQGSCPTLTLYTMEKDYGDIGYFFGSGKIVANRFTPQTTLVYLITDGVEEEVSNGIYYFPYIDNTTEDELPGQFRLINVDETYPVSISEESNELGSSMQLVTEAVADEYDTNNDGNVDSQEAAEFHYCNFFDLFETQLSSVIAKNNGSCTGKYSFSEYYDVIAERCNNFRSSHSYADFTKAEIGGNIKECYQNCEELRDYVNNRCGFESTDSCNSLGSKVMNWIYRIIKIVRYAVPALLIILSILDWIKAIASESDDEMKKVSVRFTKRLVAAALIFLIPFILDFILRMFSIPGFEASNPFCTN